MSDNIVATGTHFLCHERNLQLCPDVIQYKRLLMKRFLLSVLTLAALVCAVPARAQYYQIASQLPGLLSPALSGSFNYKGYIELSGLAGVGTDRANFVGVSTTQGFRYSSWFFMGVGLGVDVVTAQGADPDSPRSVAYGYPDYGGYEGTKTKAMIPVFSDFRFNIGDQSSVSAFIDLKLGAAWLIGTPYLRLHDAYVTNSARFYCKPTVGVRIPVNARNSSQAFNIGLTYQLLTADDDYYWSPGGNVTLNSFGVTLGYEW